MQMSEGCMKNCMMISAMLIAMVRLGQAQVPIDLSKALMVKTVMNVRIGGSVSAPWYIPNPCGQLGLDQLSIASSTGGRGFTTRPRIDTSRPEVTGLGLSHMSIDYDGTLPLELMNDNGRIDRCGDFDGSFHRISIDTVNCWIANIEPEYSMDVDGDGYLDVVCDLLGGGVLAHVILGGPNAGKGCERVAVIHGYPHNYKSLKRAFFRSSSGRWRFVQWERGQSDLSPRMFLYDVGLKRTGNTFETTFTPLDSLYGGSSSLDDDPFGVVEEIVDTVHKKDYLLIERVVNFSDRTWAVERFEITDGKFTSSGERVTGYAFFDLQNFGHSLGTDVPIIGIPSTKGRCYCYADNITTPFAVFNPAGSGLQFGGGYVAINDQTGDGKPDIVLTGGSSDGRMAVISFDQSVGVEESSTDIPTTSTARLVGDQLDVTLVAPDNISIDIATVAGQQWTAVPPTPADAGTLHYDIATLLRNRLTGAYMLRVHIGAHIISIPVIR